MESFSAGAGTKGISLTSAAEFVLGASCPLNLLTSLEQPSWEQPWSPLGLPQEEAAAVGEGPLEHLQLLYQLLLPPIKGQQQAEEFLVGGPPKVQGELQWRSCLPFQQKPILCLKGP